MGSIFGGFWPHFWLIFCFEVGGPCKDAKTAKITVSPRRESNFQGSGALKMMKNAGKSAFKAKSAPRALGRPSWGRFWDYFGSMLGSKIAQNEIQEGIEKRMRKRKRLGGVLEAPGSRFDASRGAKGGGEAATACGSQILSGPLMSFRGTRRLVEQKA